MRSMIRVGVATLVLALVAASAAWARSEPSRDIVVALADLPPQAQETVRLIRRGRPRRRVGDAAGRAGDDGALLEIPQQALHRAGGRRLRAAALDMTPRP